jgi:cation diffusion facilitator family transporter
MSLAVKGTGRAIQVTLIGLWVNIALAVVKFLAGLFGRSGALMADSVHSLSDFTTDLLALFGLSMAERPADENHHYGHGKIETLVAAVLGLIILLTGLGILAFGVIKIIRFTRGESLYRPEWVAFAAAALSVLLKEGLFNYTMRVGRKIGSELVMANAWHHRSDGLSSIGAMIGVGGAMILGDKWLILDPVAAVFVSLMVVRAAIPILRRNVEELLETSESTETERKILGVIKGHPVVNDSHKLRTRRVGGATVLDVHIEVDQSLSVVEAHDVTTEIEEKIRALLGGGTQVTIHVEPHLPE